MIQEYNYFMFCFWWINISDEWLFYRLWTKHEAFFFFFLLFMDKGTISIRFYSMWTKSFVFCARQLPLPAPRPFWVSPALGLEAPPSSGLSWWAPHPSIRRERSAASRRASRRPELRVRWLRCPTWSSLSACLPGKDMASVKLMWTFKETVPSSILATVLPSCLSYYALYSLFHPSFLPSFLH